MAFNRKDLDWRAFVTILFQVNVGILLIDEFVMLTEVNKLRSLMYQCLANHLLQMIFLRDFYDVNGKVNTKNTCVWYIHIVSYAYIIYEYSHHSYHSDQSTELSEMWIPLDIILTINIFFY